MELVAGPVGPDVDTDGGEQTFLERLRGRQNFKTVRGEDGVILPFVNSRYSIVTNHVLMTDGHLEPPYAQATHFVLLDLNLSWSAQYDFAAKIVGVLHNAVDCPVAFDWIDSSFTMEGVNVLLWNAVEYVTTAIVPFYI